MAFTCAGETLVGTLDEAAGKIGLLIVSGGNEIRMGAHRGMALLAAALAAQGVPVLRYDRRGVGDSTGENHGFESSAADIAAAVGAFREAGVARVVAFGNCDAATALALFHAAPVACGPGAIDALVLSNPWTGGDGDDQLPQAAAIRARYAERLRDPAQWLRVLRGGVDLRKLAGGLLKVARSGHDEDALVDRMASSLAASGVPTTILLAARDNTGVAFADAWAKCRHRTNVPLTMLNSASHSYAGAGDAEWLREQLLRAVRRVSEPQQHPSTVRPE